MPAPIAYRRWEGSNQDSLAPVEMYAPTQRYAILLLGTVVAISVLPLGVLPALLSGQTAIVSATLKVGDKV